MHKTDPEPTEPRHPLEVGKGAPLERPNTRLGLILFALYLAFYSLYVVLNAFWPQAMDAIPVAGVNLAILYGFGLIGGALVLALIYGWLCRE